MAEPWWVRVLDFMGIEVSGEEQESAQSSADSLSSTEVDSYGGQARSSGTTRAGRRRRDPVTAPESPTAASSAHGRGRREAAAASAGPATTGTSGVNGDWSDPRTSVAGSRAGSAHLVGLPGAAGQPMRLGIYRPKSYDDIQEVADQLKAHRACVIDLSAAEGETVRRILNFLSGTVYALDGEIYKVGASVFVAAPVSIDVTGEYSSWEPDM